MLDFDCGIPTHVFAVRGDPKFGKGDPGVLRPPCVGSIRSLWPLLQTEKGGTEVAPSVSIGWSLNLLFAARVKLCRELPVQRILPLQRWRIVPSPRLDSVVGGERW